VDGDDSLISSFRPLAVLVGGRSVATIGRFRWASTRMGSGRGLMM
jgi:hypothetical protein